MNRPWTVGLCLLILLLNAGLLLSGGPQWMVELLEWSEHDRQAVLGGQVWRLLTGNLVHWSAEHVYLDVLPFLLLGWLYEPLLEHRFPVALLAAALTVGLGVFLLAPELASYRGMSGVDSGLFAAALGVEMLSASSDRRRWWWLGPAAAIFMIKLAYECLTGELFFGTSSLGDVGLPVPVAHAAGAIAGIASALGHLTFGSLQARIHATLGFQLCGMRSSMARCPDSGLPSRPESGAPSLNLGGDGICAGTTAWHK